MDFLEQTILQQLKSGNEKAFEYIFKTYFKLLFNYANNILRSEYGAEEVLSDVFARLWENKDNLNIETSIKAYLFRSVHNICLNQLRQHKVEDKYKSFFLDYYHEECYSDSEYPFEKLVEKELQHRITMAIDSLPDQCKKMFLLSRNMELTHEEIAVQFQVSVNTVHTQIARALKKIKEELKDYIPLLMILMGNN